MIYSSEKAFNCYIDYLALKRHFTSKYDYFKYNGKVSAKQSSFENRKDKFFFYKLSKKRNPNDRLLANLLDDPKKWIGEIVEDEDVYNSWFKRNGSISRTVVNDISLFEDWKESFRPVDGNHPKILTGYIAGRVSPETLCVINSMFGVFKLWDKKIKDTIIYPDVVFKLKKYSPFLNFDKEKVLKELKNVL